TSNQTSNGATAQRRFAYDRWGNRTGMWDAVSGGTQIQTIALQQSGGAPTNRITSVTSGSTVNYTFDAAGNVTNDGAHTYTYDGENRVVSVDNGATATYKYDHQNRRVSKAIPGTSLTHYVWQGSQVIAEHDATTPLPPWWEPPYQVKSARVDYVYAGGSMVYSRQRTSSTGAWSERYYLSDRLSTRLVLDVLGNVLGRQAHLPFGEDFAESGTQEKHHFTSYERDSESGTDYAVNRQYAQGVARFASADAYAGSTASPQSLNRNTYSRNDPINMLDPLGLLTVCTCSDGGEGDCECRDIDDPETGERPETPGSEPKPTKWSKKKCSKAAQELLQKASTVMGARLAAEFLFNSSNDELKDGFQNLVNSHIDDYAKNDSLGKAYLKNIRSFWSIGYLLRQVLLDTNRGRPTDLQAFNETVSGARTAYGEGKTLAFDIEEHCAKTKDIKNAIRDFRLSGFIGTTLGALAGSTIPQS
ncbi:MAG: RHS repeat-associated core domain-containing protein, partial [Acidobacteriota bacterium]